MKKHQILALLLAAAYALPFNAYALTQLDFLMAHKPENVDNVNLIQAFADRVKTRTGGEVVITPTFPVGSVDAFENSHSAALKGVYLGTTAMSQISVKHFAKYSPAIEVLDMPMVFKSHDHATRVLDGDVGQNLRDTVFAETNGRIKGLSFTYSGGFRNVYSTKNIDSVADLKGQKMRLKGGRLSQDAMDHLGLDFVKTAPGHDFAGDWVNKHFDGGIEAEEAETLRIYSYKRQNPEMAKTIKTVLETNHSLYLTMITINGDKFAALTPEQQQILQEEAAKLAVDERDLSIAQEATYRKELQADGVKFVTISDEDKQHLTAMGKAVQQKNHRYLGSWLDAIKEAEPKTNVQESKASGTHHKPL